MIIQHFYRSGRPLRAEIFKVKNFHLHIKPVVPHTFLIGAHMSLTLSFTLSRHTAMRLCSKVTLSMSHSFTPSFTYSPHAEQLLFLCLCSKVTHTLTLTLTLSFTLSRHAEQLLFSLVCSKVTVYSRKLQWFLAGNQLYES